MPRQNPDSRETDQGSRLVGGSGPIHRAAPQPQPAQERDLIERVLGAHYAPPILTLIVVGAGFLVAYL
jgi:hypothetical protein